MLSPTHSAYPLVPYFERIIDLAEQERTALLALPVRIISFEAGQNIGRQGDRPSRAALLLEGLAATSKTTHKGERQIAALHIAGDWPDLQTLHLDSLDSDVRTLSPCVVALVDHGELRALSEENGRLGALLWRTTLIDASVLREWTTNIGRRDALARLAHLFCEIMVRMEDAGLAKGRECSLPLTQVQLGEATGMSTVHANRVVQSLREAGLIEHRSGRLQVLDWEGLVAAGEFDSEYLHRRDRTPGGSRLRRPVH